MGVYLIYFKQINANFLYNTWFLANTFFYLFFFLSVIKTKIKRKLIVVLLAVFIIVELINWQGIFNYIILGLNILMSLCFITGFIISKKEFNN